jgi:hypothetical protein
MSSIPEDILLSIQRNFHAVIHERAAHILEKHNFSLPDLQSLLNSEERKAWFPVPGMCGGFSYWFEGTGDQTKLIAESWCRVVEGSGQRHEITAEGSRLVDEGFV